MRLLIALPLVGAVAAACAPAPDVSAVEPTHADCAADVAIRIRGSALGTPVQIDLQGGSVGRLLAAVGGVGLSDVSLSGETIVEGTLPGGRLTAGGDYDVLVRTSSGAESTLPAAFHCDGEPPVDGGDDGEEVEDDAGEADVPPGPIGTIVTVSEAGSATVGSAVTVAWVVDRWVVAWVDDDGASGVLRLGEIGLGETELSGVRDVTGAGRPTDPLIRSWAGTVWLSWVDKTETPNRYHFRLLDDGLGVRADGGALGSADADVLWRRDHDVARDEGTGRFLFVAPVFGAAAVSLIENDGTVTVRNAPLGTMEAPPSEPRAAFAGGSFRLVWWENPAAGSKCRAAVVAADGAVAAGPLDLALDGATAAPVPWPDDRSGVERLFVCHESIASAMVRNIHHRFFDLDFGVPTADAALAGTGRVARCGGRDGLLVWSVLSTLATFSVATVEPDGATADVATGVGHGVRAAPGVDVAAAPDRFGLAWLEDRGPGLPEAVRFVEVRPEL